MLKTLEEMDNEDLAETVNFFCIKCPVNNYCTDPKNNTKTCQEIIYEWLNK